MLSCWATKDWTLKLLRNYTSTKSQDTRTPLRRGSLGDTDPDHAGGQALSAARHCGGGPPG